MERKPMNGVIGFGDLLRVQPFRPVFKLGGYVFGEKSENGSRDEQITNPSTITSTIMKKDSGVDEG